MQILHNKLKLSFKLSFISMNIQIISFLTKNNSWCPCMLNSSYSHLAATILTCCFSSSLRSLYEVVKYIRQTDQNSTFTLILQQQFAVNAYQFWPVWIVMEYFYRKGTIVTFYDKTFTEVNICIMLYHWYLYKKSVWYDIWNIYITVSKTNEKINY